MSVRFPSLGGRIINTLHTPGERERCEKGIEREEICVASSPLPAEEEGEREGTELRWGFDGHSHGPARFRTIVGHNWWGGARKEEA